MVDYDRFAAFYDATQTDHVERAAYVRELIEKHHPDARAVLELACGTGLILEQLSEDFVVAGIDLSEQMLFRARERLPGAQLVHADMTEVDLGKTFDVVICVYDSINHLLRFEQWERVFDRALEHLDNGGIFVFDSNTELKLASFAGPRLWSSFFGERNLLVMNVDDCGDGTYAWNIRVFERIENAEYRLHEERILEKTFPREQIAAALEPRFRRVWTYDAQRSRPTTRSERLYFVCRR